MLKMSPDLKLTHQIKKEFKKNSKKQIKGYFNIYFKIPATDMKTNGQIVQGF